MIRRLLILALMTGIFFQGCSRIEEPWVEKKRLVQERTRSPEAVSMLRHRFFRVQSDR